MGGRLLYIFVLAVLLHAPIGACNEEDSLLSFEEKILILAKIEEISESVKKDPSYHVIIETISPTLLKFSLVKGKSTEDKGYLELELLPPLSEKDSLRRDKFLAEEIEKLQLLEEPTTSEIRNYTWKDRLYGWWAYWLTPEGSMAQEVKEESDREIKAIKRIVELKDIRSFDALLEVSKPSRRYHANTTWTAKEAIHDLKSVFFIEQLEEAIVSFEKDLLEREKDKENSSPILNSTLEATIETLKIEIKERKAGKPRDTYLPSYITYNYTEAAKAVPHALADFVRKMGRDTLLEAPYTAPTRIAAGFVRLVVSVASNSIDTVSGLVTGGAYGSSGETLGRQVTDAALLLAPIAKAKPLALYKSWKANRLVKRASPLQKEAIQKAHEVGLNRHLEAEGREIFEIEIGKDGKNPSGIGNYSVSQLLRKTRILKKAGYKPHEIHLLMETGRVGILRLTLQEEQALCSGPKRIYVKNGKLVIEPLYKPYKVWRKTEPTAPLQSQMPLTYEHVESSNIFIIRQARLASDPAPAIVHQFEGTPAEFQAFWPALVAIVSTQGSQGSTRLFSPTDEEFYNEVLQSEVYHEGDIETTFHKFRDSKGQTSYEFLVDAVKDLRGKKVMDLASGSGPVAKIVLKKVGPDGHVFVLDFNKKELDLAQKDIPETNVTFLHESAQDIPLMPVSLDVIFCHLAVMLFRPLEPVASEIARILKPGGTFSAIILPDNLFHTSSPTFNEYLEAAAQYDSPTLDLHKWGWGDLGADNVKGFKAIFNEALGFSPDVKTDDVVLELEDTPENLLIYLRAFFQTSYLLHANKATQKEYEERLLQVLKKHASPEGRTHFQLPFVRVTVKKKEDANANDLMLAQTLIENTIAKYFRLTADKRRIILPFSGIEIPAFHFFELIALPDFPSMVEHLDDLAYLEVVVLEAPSHFGKKDKGDLSKLKSVRVIPHTHPKYRRLLNEFFPRVYGGKVQARYVYNRLNAEVDAPYHEIGIMSDADKDSIAHEFTHFLQHLPVTPDGNVYQADDKEAFAKRLAQTEKIEADVHLLMALCDIRDLGRTLEDVIQNIHSTIDYLKHSPYSNEKEIQEILADLEKLLASFKKRFSHLVVQNSSFLGAVARLAEGPNSILTREQFETLMSQKRMEVLKAIKTLTPYTANPDVVIVLGQVLELEIYDDIRHEIIEFMGRVGTRQAFEILKRYYYEDSESIDIIEAAYQRAFQAILRKVKEKDQDRELEQELKTFIQEISRR